MTDIGARRSAVAAMAPGEFVSVWADVAGGVDDSVFERRDRA